MFKPKEECAICGVKLRGLHQITGGSVCGMCLRITTHTPMCTVEQLRETWEENHRRLQSFNPGTTLSGLGRNFVFIDMEQQLILISETKKYVPKSKLIQMEPILFKYSEIEDFRIEQVGQKTVTKHKGGIGRAVVGGAVFGPVGAIVGATTSKQETKQTGGTPVLIVDVNINGLKTTLSIQNPPDGALDYLSHAVEQASNG